MNILIDANVLREYTERLRGFQDSLERCAEFINGNIESNRISDKDVKVILKNISGISNAIKASHSDSCARLKKYVKLQRLLDKNAKSISDITDEELFFMIAEKGHNKEYTGIMYLIDEYTQMVYDLGNIQNFTEELIGKIKGLNDKMTGDINIDSHHGGNRLVQETVNYSGELAAIKQAIENIVNLINIDAGVIEDNIDLHSVSFPAQTGR